MFNDIYPQEFTPDLDSKFKRQVTGGVSPCNFVFCILNGSKWVKVGQFKSESGIESSLEAEVLSSLRDRKSYSMPSKESFSEVSLSIGVGSSNFIRQWYNKSANSYKHLLNSAIAVVDSVSNEIVRFVCLKRSWVSGFMFPEISGESVGESPIESIKLLHGGFAFCDIFSGADSFTIYNSVDNNSIEYYKSSTFYADNNDVLGLGHPAGIVSRKSLTVDDFLFNIY